MKVFLLTIISKHGETHEVFAYEEQAKNALAMYVEESWSYSPGGDMPEDTERAVEQFFGRYVDDNWSIEELYFTPPLDVPVLVSLTLEDVARIEAAVDDDDDRIEVEGTFGTHTLPVMIGRAG